MKRAVRLFGLLVAFAAAWSGPAARGETPRRALAAVSAACLRAEPRHGAEMVSQVVMGTPVEVAEVQGDWVSVVTPEGYHGWVRDNSLRLLSGKEFEEWTKAPRVIVTGADTRWVDAINRHGRVSDVVGGCILAVTGRNAGGDSLLVRLPDGRAGRVAVEWVKDLSQWANQPPWPQELGEYSLTLMGVPYLWGGTTSKGMDCSGLTKMAWYEQGVILPRDASQQARLGRQVWLRPASRGNLTVTDRTVHDAIAQAVADTAGGFRPGDLLFFGNPATGRVNHVGIYLRDGVMVHCAGRVRVNSIVPGSRTAHKGHLLEVRRLAPDDLPRLSARNHPLYFPQRREPLYGE